MASSTPFDAALTEVERLLEQVSASLLSGDALLLDASSQALRKAVLAFSTAASTAQQTALSADPVMKQRLARVSQALAHQREGMARRAVVVGQALSAILPRAETATYSGGGAPIYRNSAARIYANLAT